MRSHDPNTQAEPAPVGGPSAAASSPEVAPPWGAAPRARLWLFALAAGVAAGLASWLGGEAAYGSFKPVIVLPADWGKMNPYQKTDVLANLTLTTHLEPLSVRADRERLTMAFASLLAHAAAPPSFQYRCRCHG